MNGCSLTTLYTINNTIYSLITYTLTTYKIECIMFVTTLILLIIY
jgi:hypothetical protein